MQADHGPKGRASLEVSMVFNESTVTGAYAATPMKLLTPRSRGRSVCAYVSNFGGGLVAGDQTCLELRLGKEARCFIGTQSSTKVYRNPASLPCAHETQARLDSGALLVFAPAAVQPFAGSSYVQRQRFHLAPGAGLVLLDWFTSGRRARGERWAFRRFGTRNAVWRSAPESNRSNGTPSSNTEEFRSSVARASSLASQGGISLPANTVKGERPLILAGDDARATDSGLVAGLSPPQECVFLDSLQLNSEEGRLVSPYCTGRFNCFAMLLLIGAVLKETAVSILQETDSLATPRRAALLVSASPIKDGVVLRVAGEEMADVDRHLRRYLEPLTVLLGDDPWSHRY